MSEQHAVNHGRPDWRRKESGTLMMRRLLLSAAVLAVAGLSLVAVAALTTHGSASVSAQGPTRTVELDGD